MRSFSANCSSQETDPRRAGLFSASEAASEIGTARTVILFTEGKHPEHVLSVARGAAEAVPGATIIVASGAGTVDSTGESGRGRDPKTTALALDVECTAEVAEPVDSQLQAAAGEIAKKLKHRSKRPCLFFARQSSEDERQMSEETVDAFVKGVGGATVVGAGLPEHGRVAVVRGGELRAGTQLGVRIDGGLRMLTGVSAGVTPITEMMTIGKMDGPVVASLNGSEPLPLLERAVLALNREVVVLCSVLRQSANTSHPSIMNIRGIEPPSSIRLDASVQEGDKLAFTVLDPEAGQSDFEAILKNTESELRGGVPYAGFLFTCDLRSRSFSGAPGLHAGLTQDRFTGLPFAGLRGPFEIASQENYPNFRCYSRVFALLYKPS